MSERKVIGVSEACLGKEEETAVQEVIRSGWLSQGEKVQAFEKAFTGLTGLEGVAVDSCTAGLHLLLAANGIGPEQEVLVPAVTFVATVNAVIYCGARPVPVDIMPACPHMSLDAAEAALSPRTRAVLIMHYAGYRMDIAAWKDFAQSHGLLLLEDAAHCPGLEGIGQQSRGAVLSFFANKNMTTAEGGMILTQDAELAAKLRRLRGHGMTTTTLTRAAGHAYTYDVDMLGWNYRMDELRAAVGLAQLAKLPAHNARRLELTALYRRLLQEKAPWLTLPFTADHPTVAHIMPVLLPASIDRARFMQELRAAGIQSSIHYPLYHRFTWHRQFFGELSLPHAEDWCSRTVTLPLHPRLSDADVCYIAESVARLGPACGLK